MLVVVGSAQARLSGSIGGHADDMTSSSELVKYDGNAVGSMALITLEQESFFSQWSLSDLKEVRPKLEMIQNMICLSPVVVRERPDSTPISCPTHILRAHAKWGQPAKPTACAPTCPDCPDNQDSMSKMQGVFGKVDSRLPNTSRFIPALEISRCNRAASHASLPAHCAGRRTSNVCLRRYAHDPDTQPPTSQWCSCFSLGGPAVFPCLAAPDLAGTAAERRKFEKDYAQRKFNILCLYDQLPESVQQRLQRERMSVIMAELDGRIDQLWDQVLSPGGSC